MKRRWSMAMRNALARCGVRAACGGFAGWRHFWLAGCEHLHQDMGNQPKNRPLSPSDFFADGRSERPPVENTVARGALADDELVVAKESNTFPLPVNAGAAGTRRRALQDFLHAVPRLAGRRQRHGGHARHEASAELSHRSAAASRPTAIIYDVITNGFGADVQLLGADSAARPLGHHRVRARAATQPQRARCGIAGGCARETEFTEAAAK